MIADKVRAATASGSKLDLTKWYSPPTGVVGATWTGSRYVAVGYEWSTSGNVKSKIVTSTDLTTWTTVTLPSNATTTLGAIAWSGSVLVACGPGQVLRSTNGGTSWTVYDRPVSYGYSVKWLNNQFVIADGDNILFSSDGITWTTRSTSGTFAFDVEWTGSVYIIVGDSAAAATSPDGITWTARSTGISSAEALSSIVWNAGVGRAVAVGTTGVITTTGSGGASWTARTSGTTADLRTVVFTSGTYIAAGTVGRVIYSSDGITWTVSTRSPQPTYSSIVWTGTTSVFFSYEGGIVTSGSVGSTLTQVYGATSIDLESVKSTPYGFVSVGGYNTYGSVEDAHILTSSDGIYWLYAAPTTTRFYGCAASSVRTVAVGAGGAIFSANNTSLDTWTARTSNTTQILRDVEWSGSIFVVVGNSGVIRTSPDGITWTSRTSGTTADLNRVAWTGSLFIVTGSGGTIRTSSDGITWTSRTSGTTNELFDIAVKNTNEIIVAASTTGIKSTDGGVTWNAVTFPASMISLVSDGKKYIAYSNTFSTGGAYESSNGSTWIKRYQFDDGYYIGTPFIRRLAWSSNLNRLVAVGDYGFVARTE